MKEVGVYRWGASRNHQLQKLVYGAFRNLGFSVVQMPHGYPHFLVAKDGYTALVLVGVTNTAGRAAQEASVRAFLALWQGHVFNVSTPDDVAYAANRMEVMGRAAALGAEPCIPQATTPDASSPA